MEIALIRRVVSAVLGCVILSCAPLFAGEPGQVDDGVGTLAEKACFRVRDVRSFDAVDDRFVYVRGVRNQHFLLTMENVCMGLENSVGVAIANGFDRVCSNDRAMIAYKDFNQLRRCAILKVEEVADRDAALKLVKERNAVPDDQADGEKKKTAATE